MEGEAAEHPVACIWGKAAPGMRGSAEGAEPEGATPRPAEKRQAVVGYAVAALGKRVEAAD